jgi:hypothetical protein
MSEIQTPAAQTPAAWCAAVQAKLMAALDAAWALAERSDDPAVIAKARDKAKLCGQMAAEARKIAAMIPQPKPSKPLDPLDAVQKALDTLNAATSPSAVRQAEAEARPPAAQAVAMQSALKKLKRR